METTQVYILVQMTVVVVGGSVLCLAAALSVLGRLLWVFSHRDRSGQATHGGIFNQVEVDSKGQDECATDWRNISRKRKENKSSGIDKKERTMARLSHRFSLFLCFLSPKKTPCVRHLPWVPYRVDSASSSQSRAI